MRHRRFFLVFFLPTGTLFAFSRCGFGSGGITMSPFLMSGGMSIFSTGSNSFCGGLSLFGFRTGLLIARCFFGFGAGMRISPAFFFFAIGAAPLKIKGKAAL